ncbi:MAG: HAMP domain-containing histidine kinase [Proteobacteria bacterium]|uniref:ATP-binding protein n=1 Tax=Pseudomonas kurunegalensis TaxID=485880 RepID=UPI001CDCA080|nr:ATP-binding protein [Pseudomonas kurunegalensis]MBS0510478.1 HAMP domain-containing histidine kinase [Pseudomonadota bacterium]MCA4079120.1 HAMP domain-containing protein [Pseudomonas kurunegalensis]
MKLVGLSRQIALTMMAMAFGVTLLVVLTSYVFYFFAISYWPNLFSQPTLVPTGPEWIWIATTTLAGLAFAVVVAVHLARRILVPLNSVTDSIRRVAQGDLEARAVAGDRSLGEAAGLADDFNALATQLQRTTGEMAFWNAAIAHELRTPVTILRGRLQGLAEGVFTPDASQFRSLLNQVEGLTRLIEDLRVVSLAGSGHLGLQVRDANLSTEVESVVDFCRHALQVAGQHPVLDLQAGSVQCDPVRIRQALLALLENVRRHAVPGVVLVQTRQEHGWCSLRVEDDGPGIPPESATQVFRAFRRVRSGDEAGADAGSGLGLAVVAAIARAHGGEASCIPSTRGGACFELRWPQRTIDH